MNKKHKKQMISGLIGGGIAISFLALLFHLFNCDRNAAIARLALPRQRSLLISGDYCWEASRRLYYKVVQRHRVITPTSVLLSSDHGDNYQYQVVVSESGDLVGVLRAKHSISLQSAELILIQDFKSGKTWTSLQQYSELFDKSEAEKRTLLQQYRSLFDRLRRENLQIPLPDDLAASAPTIR